MKKFFSILLVLCVVCLFFTSCSSCNTGIDKSSTNNDASKDDLNGAISFVENESVVYEKSDLKEKYVVPPKIEFKNGQIFDNWDQSLIVSKDKKEISPKYISVKDPAIEVEKVFVDSKEKTAKVNIYVHNNPGISSLMFDLFYEDMLIKDIMFDKNFGENVTFSDKNKMPVTLSMISPLENIDCSGLLVTVLFDLSKCDVSDEITRKPISVKLNKENTFDSEFKDIEFEIFDGYIQIIKN